MARRVGLYPGTFDPIHNGHLDILTRAVKLVDKLVIGVVINIRKGPLFTLDERVDMVVRETAHLSNVTEIEVRPIEGLTIQFAASVGAAFMVRGLRAYSDYEHEFQLAATNQQLDHEIETVFLMADPRHQAVASSLVKEIASFGGDISPFVSSGVAERLLRKLRPA